MLADRGRLGGGWELFVDKLQGCRQLFGIELIHPVEWEPMGELWIVLQGLGRVHWRDRCVYLVAESDPLVAGFGLEYIS